MSTSMYPQYVNILSSMNCHKGLYVLLKENDRIECERITLGPFRSRQKAMGYMWESQKEVTLKGGAVVHFYFWHHFHGDDGSDASYNWICSEKRLTTIWRPRFVPISPEPGTKSVDASWHLFSVDGHFYVSKLGTFSSIRDENEIIKKIQDGSWNEDADL